MADDDIDTKNLIPPRKGFSAHQRHAAQKLGSISPKEYRSRRHTITHPIDDVHPNIVSDRDDGIFVETAPEGDGYRVHITIADVAGYIPLDNPLADVAHERAFTVYRPWMIDHMFPSALMERMSLEHQQERLGLSVIIHLNNNFQPIHTELEPVITESSAADYDMATDYMKSTTEFSQMAAIAKGVKDNFFGQENEMIREFDDAPFASRYNTPKDSPDIGVKKMIETYMLLANYAVANIFARTELPFMYRNFDGTYLNGTPPVERAYYSTDCTEHNALPYAGPIQNSYCHFTSPIRRGPDFYNGHMAHHAIEVMQEAEAGIRAIFPPINQPTLHYALWEHASELLNQTRTAEGTRHAAKTETLQTLFNNIVSDVAGDTNLQKHRASLKELAMTIADIAPPLSKTQLADYADEINPLNDQESKIRSTLEVKQAFDLSEKKDLWERNLDALTPDSLAPKDKEAFSTLLRQAAATGRLPECLRDEALTRIKEGKYNDAEDSLSIMIEAPYPHDPDWNKLKRRIAKSIKHNPTTINNVFEMAANRGLLPEGCANVTTVMLPALNDDGTLSEVHNFVTAYLALPATDDSPALACPYYSVGHDKRSAESHARYSFLEHYAFGQLKPISEVAIPNILYAELDEAHENKEMIVRKMIEESGGELFISLRETRDGEHIAMAKVVGNIFPHKILTYAVEQNENEAKSTALKRLLRNTTFKHAMSLLNPLDMHQTQNPLQELKKYATDHNVILSFATKEISKKSNNPAHQVTAILTNVEGVQEFFSQRAPNRDRALLAACVEALRHKDWLTAQDALLTENNSWAADTANRHTP